MTVRHLRSIRPCACPNPHPALRATLSRREREKLPQVGLSGPQPQSPAPWRKTLGFRRWNRRRPDL